MNSFPLKEVDNAYETVSFICMRTTLDLRKDLVDQAMRLTGVQEKTKLIHLGLEELIRKAACQGLIELGGTMPNLKVSPRNRQLGKRKKSNK